MPVIMAAFPPLTRAATSGFASLGCYNIFSQPGEPRAWLKRQYGMGVQYLVMTTPATHKERFR